MTEMFTNIHPVVLVLMKSTKVQNPRRILHILRSMRVHRAGGAGFGQKLYACALLIIDGLGHATPVSRNSHIIFRALVALEPLLSLMSRFGACSARISRESHTHTDTHTDTQNDYRTKFKVSKFEL